MTHLFLFSADVCAQTVMDVVAGALIAVGVVHAVVVIVEILLSCTYVLLWGYPPKRVCPLKVPKL